MEVTKPTRIVKTQALQNVLCSLYSVCDRIVFIEKTLTEIQKNESYKILHLDDNYQCDIFSCRLADVRHMILDFCKPLQDKLEKLVKKYYDKELNRKKKRRFKITIEEKK